MHRKTILWLGGSPAPQAIALCEAGDFTLQAVESLSEKNLAEARGLILHWPCELGAAIAALRHGAVPVIFCNFAEIPEAGRAIDSLDLKYGKRLIGIEQDSQEAVRRICRSEHAPHSNPSLEIVGGEKLDEEHILLLTRAFNDCNRLRLLAELGTSANVFQAYARLTDSRAGPLALPFFIKFDERARTEQELRNYRECTTLHVPFNQRPNVDPTRCALGDKSGVIVGNFVERSESLQSVADRGAALAPLQSLFNSALRGWRLQAHILGKDAIRNAVLALELRRCLPSTYKPNRLRKLGRHAVKAKEYFGTTLDYPELEKRLRALPAISFRYAIAHNDLHGENVRVTGQDAILIDFLWANYGPLSVDPASLEASLVLKTRTVDGSEWERLADSLFGLDALTRVPAPLPPEDKCAPISDAVRFIRQIALPDALDPLEYPIAVVLQLIRKASYGHQDRRGAKAYAAAEKLLIEVTEAFAKRTAKPSTACDVP